MDCQRAVEDSTNLHAANIKFVSACERCQNDATTLRGLDIIFKRKDTNAIALRRVEGQNYALLIPFGGFYVKCPPKNGNGCKSMKPVPFNGVDSKTNACVLSNDREQFRRKTLEAGEGAKIDGVLNFNFGEETSRKVLGNKKSWVAYFADKGADRKEVTTYSPKTFPKDNTDTTAVLSPLKTSSTPSRGERP